MQTVREWVFQNLDNLVANGYTPNADDEAEASEMLNETDVTGTPLEAAGDLTEHVQQVAYAVAEWKRLRS
jgi:hypothetical protein